MVQKQLQTDEGKSNPPSPSFDMPSATQEPAMSDEKKPRCAFVPAGRDYGGARKGRKAIRIGRSPIIMDQHQNSPVRAKEKGRRVKKSEKYEKYEEWKKRRAKSKELRLAGRLFR